MGKLLGHLVFYLFSPPVIFFGPSVFIFSVIRFRFDVPVSLFVFFQGYNITLKSEQIFLQKSVIKRWEVFKSFFVSKCPVLHKDVLIRPNDHFVVFFDHFVGWLFQVYQRKNENLN